MAYDLRFEPWIPWRRRSGRVQWGPVAMLTDDLSGDPVTAIEAPRPDFAGALTEFLIGLLTVALLPLDEADWRSRWIAPPTPEELARALDALPAAFFLDGDGPRFLQDLNATDLSDCDLLPIERLLFDAPGEQAVGLNKDLFVKRERATALGPAAPAIALITMQTYAPSGGQGHRTSMRGGGPLTTLVDPRSASGGTKDGILWSYLWANAETKQAWTERGPTPMEVAPAAIFPWMGPTRQSSKAGGGPTTPTDGHPLQAYFGMPRRLRLEFGQPGSCDLTGMPTPSLVIGYRTRNYGIQYDGWVHPLSPYYRSRQRTEWLPVHPQPAGIGWKDWYALTVEGADQGSRPAQVVGRFKSERARAIGRRSVRINAFGVDFDNMKCRGWVEAALPIFTSESEVANDLLQDSGGRMTRAAEVAATALRLAVKSALFAAPGEVAGDFAGVSADLWSATEQPFYAALARLADGQGDAAAAHHECAAFQRVLAEATLEVFDRWCPVESLAPAALRRAVAARYSLTGTLQGRGKLGSKLLAELQVAHPVANGRKSGSRKKKGGAPK